MVKVLAVRARYHIRRSLKLDIYDKLPDEHS
jgi:hypothetical protein